MPAEAVKRMHIMAIDRRRILALCGAATLFTALPRGATAAQTKGKIGIIGAGRLGSILAKAFATPGYDVMLSARDVTHVKELVANDRLGANVRAGSPQEAAAFGDIVVLCVPYAALPQIGKDYATELKGKIVIDACNPEKSNGDMIKDALEKGTGVMDPQYLPGTRLVRGFNTVPYYFVPSMTHRSGELIGIPLAADDKDALAAAAQLVSDMGFEPVIVGGLATAKSFDIGTPVYGKALTASALRTALNLKS
jgi:hypothetical protein